MDGSDVAAVPEAGFRSGESSSEGSLETRRRSWARVALETLIGINAVAFLGASIIHFGIPIPLGVTTLADVTILPAGIVEGAIGIGFIVATAAVLARRDWAWSETVGAHVFGILGVLIGLSVTLRDPGDSSSANFQFHLAILPVLAADLVLLMTKSGKAALGRLTARNGGRP